MLLKDFIKEAVSSLEKEYPEREARSIVSILCEFYLGVKSYTHIIEPQTKIPPDKENLLSAALSRLENGEPIQYVTGEAEFCSLKFKVNENVLIPRPETEILCEEAVRIGKMVQSGRALSEKKDEPVRILDLCTGSGCIAWVVALNVPGSKVIGVDVSEAALEVASNQDFSSLVRERGATEPTFIKGDVLGEISPSIKGSFDLILSNPPYILDSEKGVMRRNVLGFEPSIALFVPDDDPLLFHKAIARWSKRLLSPEGTGIVEVNETLGESSADVFREAGYKDVSIIHDFSGKNRFVRYGNRVSA